MANWTNQKKQHEITASERTEPGIPVSRLLPIVERAISEHRAEHTDDIAQTLLNEADYRVYLRMMKGGAYVQFNTADRLLTRLGLTHVWYTELSDLYEL